MLNVRNLYLEHLISGRAPVKLCLLLASGCLLNTVALAQENTAAASYSFTISGSQTWTDTGVDLASGDEVALTAEAKPGSADCSPAGMGAASEKSALASAPAGALIARSSEEGTPVVIGSSGHLQSPGAGHLFLGFNQAAPSNCSYLVKAQVIHSQAAKAATNIEAAKPAEGGTTPASQKTAENSASNGSAGGSGEKQDIKSQLSSAAQVWLKGQFGTSGASSGTSQASAAAVGNGAAASANASTGGVKLPTVVLDADLRKHIDGLPRRVDDHAGHLGDMVNFLIVGSQEQMQAALQAADWHLADVDNKEAGLKAVLNTYQKKEYLEMPMSHLYLFDRMQDFGYEQAQVFAVVATRHHFRIWKAPFNWNNEVVWVGAATHDIGFEKDIRTGKLTHKIDPNIDEERENLAQGIEKSGKAKSITYYLPPEPVQEAKNASGGSYHSDGRLLVVFLK
jgi:hypothetical protein